MSLFFYFLQGNRVALLTSYMNINDMKRARCMQCCAIEYLNNEPNFDHFRMPMAHLHRNQGEKTSSKVNQVQ